MILPDYLAPDLRVVFCGTAAGERSAAVGHYYSGRGNEFWTFLYKAALTPHCLRPTEDATVLRYGIGLTDLVKDVAASNDRGLQDQYDVAAFVEKIERFRPRWVAFHGKTAGSLVSRSLGHGRDVALGVQRWQIGSAGVFILPSASAANRDASRLEGKRDRTEWFNALHGLVEGAEHPLLTAGGYAREEREPPASVRANLT